MSISRETSDSERTRERDSGSVLLPLETHLAQRWFPEQWVPFTTLVAVSGGADSVALLRVLHALSVSWKERKGHFRGRLIVAHVNHQLRGEESEEDSRFVSSVCSELNLPLRTTRINIPHTSDGLESEARRQRYAFLEQTASQTGARYVVTAHTRSDQAETILYRILRGTGISGLAGISFIRPLNEVTVLVRPFLDVSRDEILRYLAEKGQCYRTDSSNTHMDYTRNRIRLELLPLLKRDYNPYVEDALIRLALLSGQIQEVVNDEMEKAFSESVKFPSADRARIATHYFRTHPCSEYVQAEIFRAIWSHHGWKQRDMSCSQWNMLVDMLKTAVSGPDLMMKDHAVCVKIFPDGVRAEIRPGEMWLTRPEI